MRSVKGRSVGPDTRSHDRLSPLFEIDCEPYLWKTILYNAKDHDLYEVLRRVNVRLSHAPLCAWITELAEFEQAQSILEIGCGTGETLFSLSQRFPSKRFLGVDGSREMIQLARARYDYRENLEYRMGSPEKLKESSVGQNRPAFDLIVVHLDEDQSEQVDLSSSLNHIQTILAPGGRVLLLSRSIRWKIFQPHPLTQEGFDHNKATPDDDKLEDPFKRSCENYPIARSQEKRALFVKILLEREIHFRRLEKEQGVDRAHLQGGLKELYAQLTQWMKSKESFAQISVDRWDHSS